MSYQQNLKIVTKAKHMYTYIQETIKYYTTWKTICLSSIYIHILYIRDKLKARHKKKTIRHTIIFTRAFTHSFIRFLFILPATHTLWKRLQFPEHINIVVHNHICTCYTITQDCVMMTKHNIQVGKGNNTQHVDVMANKIKAAAFCNTFFAKGKMYI